MQASYSIFYQRQKESASDKSKIHKWQVRMRFMGQQYCLQLHTLLYIWLLCRMSQVFLHIVFFDLTNFFVLLCTLTAVHNALHTCIGSSVEQSQHARVLYWNSNIRFRVFNGSCRYELLLLRVQQKRRSPWNVSYIWFNKT